MNCVQHHYFNSTFPLYFAQQIHQFIHNDDDTSVFALNDLTNKIFALFQNHVGQGQFFKITTKILEESVELLVRKFEEGTCNLKELKQSLFLQLYVEKLCQKFEQNIENKYCPQKLNKILWEIRLQLQFSGGVGESQNFILQMLGNLEISKTSERYKNQIKQILKANEFDCQKYLPLFDSQPEREAPVQYSEKSFDFLDLLAKPKKYSKLPILKQNVKRRGYNRKLVEKLKKRKQKTILNKGRTLFMSHPMKFIVRGEERPSNVIEYIEQDSCY